MRARMGWAVVLWALCSVAPAKDPLAGSWLGSMGSDKERVPVALEFVPAENGAWTVRFSNPTLNVYDTDPGGTLVVDGDRLRLETLYLDLRLSGDTLSGTRPGPNSRAELKRVRSLPVEQAPPKLPPGPAPRWQVRLSGLVYASPAVADGVACIGGSGGVFQAIATVDGALKWTFSAGKPIHGTAAIDGNGAYFVCDDGHLYKLARGDGTLVWKYALAETESP